MEQTADEVKRLKACINDLISILALPAMWSGYEPAQILSTLLDVLLRMVRLEFAYARLDNSIAGGAPIEMIRSAQRRDPTFQPQEIGQRLNPWLTGDRGRSPLVIPNPVGEGTVSIAPLRLALQHELGVLVVGSRRADFPTDIEMLLLRVAVNQAAIRLQEARLSSEQRRGAEELEQRVLERTSQLTAANEELRKEVVERRRAEQRLGVQYAITLALAESDTLTQVTARLLQAIGECMEWEWGALWIVDREAALLRCQSIWHPPNIDAAEFDAICRQMHFTRGQGLPGHVWQSHTPIWIVDAIQNPKFVRAPIAAKVGLRGAIAFPILLSGGTLGVMEFFSRMMRQPDEQQLATLSAIGSQVGQFVERKRAEEALRKSEERWRAVFENSAAGIALANFSGRFLAANSAYQKMLGYSEEELRELSFLDITHEDYREANSELDTELLEGKRQYFEMEKRYRRKDANLIWARVHVSLVPGTESIPRFFLAIVEDITERKRAEDALRHSEADLAEAQRLSHTGSFGWRTSTGEIIWSEESFRIFEYDPANCTPTLELVLQRIHPEDIALVQQTIDRASRHGTDWDLEHRLLMPDGSVKYVHVVTHAVRDESGKLEFVGAVLDVTERKQAEEALHKAQAELAHVTRVTTLGEMTASIAHELNQPLGAVVNNASASLRWLAANNLEEARQSATLIIADAHRAGEIIHRVRALAKKAPPRKDWLDVNETILEVIALARSEAQKNRVSLQTQLSSDLPLILGDRIQLQQVILNLIINAIEAMSGVNEGPRELLIRSGTDESQDVLVAVRDSGPGLDPNSLDHLFTAFFTTKPQGMGMGLAISRSIIEAHGGRLWPTPNDGPGATFQFTLDVGRKEGRSAND
jgi:PAS domain S-box-containing protein